MDVPGYLAGYLSILVVIILTVTNTIAALDAEFTTESDRIFWVEAGSNLEIPWEYDLRDDRTGFAAVRLVQYIGDGGGLSKVISAIKADNTVLPVDPVVAAFENRVEWKGNLQDDISKASFLIKNIQTAQTEYKLSCELYIGGSVKVYQPVNVSIGVKPSNVQFEGEYTDDGTKFDIQADATYSKEFILSYSAPNAKPSPELICTYDGKEIKHPERLTISATGSYSCFVRNPVGKGGEINFVKGDGGDPDTGARTVDDGVIAGSVIAVVFVIGVIVVVVFICVKKKRASAPRQPDQPKRSSSSVHPMEDSAPEQGKQAPVPPHNSK